MDTRYLLLAVLPALLAAAPAAAPLIIAHRGASRDAPENTLAAFKLAWERGADGIEGDFQLTKDGRIVCLHDATTKRTADRDLRVADSALVQLRRLDMGSWKDKKWAGQRIPTLEEVLATVPAGRRIFIEIKCGPEIVPILERLLARSPLRPEQTAVISFSDKVIAETKKRIPRIKAYWLTGYKKDEKTGRTRPSVDDVLRTLRRIKADGLDTQAHDLVDRDFVRTLRDARMELHAWTINDPAAAARFRAMGFDSITTDRPGYVREALRIPVGRSARAPATTRPSSSKK